MSVGVVATSGPVPAPAKVAAQQLSAQPKAQADVKTAAPARPAPVLQDAAALPAEDQAFQVSTINQRLAWLAASRSQDPAPAMDLKA